MTSFDTARLNALQQELTKINAALQQNTQKHLTQPQTDGLRLHLNNLSRYQQELTTAYEEWEKIDTTPLPPSQTENQPQSQQNYDKLSEAKKMLTDICALAINFQETGRKLQSLTRSLATKVNTPLHDKNPNHLTTTPNKDSQPAQTSLNEMARSAGVVMGAIPPNAGMETSSSGSRGGHQSNKRDSRITSEQLQDALAQAQAARESTAATLSESDISETADANPEIRLTAEEEAEIWRESELLASGNDDFNSVSNSNDAGSASSSLSSHTSQGHQDAAELAAILDDDTDLTPTTAIPRSSSPEPTRSKGFTQIVAAVDTVISDPNTSLNVRPRTTSKTIADVDLDIGKLVLEQTDSSKEVTETTFQHNLKALSSLADYKQKLVAKRDSLESANTHTSTADITKIEPVIDKADRKIVDFCTQIAEDITNESNRLSHQLARANPVSTTQQASAATTKSEKNPLISFISRAGSVFKSETAKPQSKNKSETQDSISTEPTTKNSQTAPVMPEKLKLLGQKIYSWCKSADGSKGIFRNEQILEIKNKINSPEAKKINEAINKISDVYSFIQTNPNNINGDWGRALPRTSTTEASTSTQSWTLLSTREAAEVAAKESDDKNTIPAAMPGDATTATDDDNILDLLTDMTEKLKERISSGSAASSTTSTSAGQTPASTSPPAPLGLSAGTATNDIDIDSEIEALFDDATPLSPQATTNVIPTPPPSPSQQPDTPPVINERTTTDSQQIKPLPTYDSLGNTNLYNSNGQTLQFAKNSQPATANKPTGKSWLAHSENANDKTSDLSLELIKGMHNINYSENYAKSDGKAQATLNMLLDFAAANATFIANNSPATFISANAANTPFVIGGQDYGKLAIGAAAFRAIGCDYKIIPGSAVNTSNPTELQTFNTRVDTLVSKISNLQKVQGYKDAIETLKSELQAKNTSSQTLSAAGSEAHQALRAGRTMHDVGSPAATHTPTPVSTIG